MKIGDLSYEGFYDLVSRRPSGLDLQIGPLRIRLGIDVAVAASLVHRMWRDYPVTLPEGVADVHARLVWGGGVRRWIRPQIRFLVDGQSPFHAFPAHHHLTILEWGINWGIAKRCHHLLMLHSAVVERDGYAILLPAWPGHGKSTLCAALAHSGWRLLSDEFGLLRLEDGALLPFPRLIPLKNESIAVIRSFAPDADIGPRFFRTRKGVVAHLRPPSQSVERMAEPCMPGWLVFPRWVPGSRLRLEPMLKTEAFLMVATNAFNYEVLGRTSFELVARLVEACHCYSLVYSDLAEAVAVLDQLPRVADG